MMVPDVWVESFPQLLAGLELSLQVTGGSLLLGLPLGVVLAIGNSSRKFAVKTLSLTITEIGRSTPALVVLQFLYFGLPAGGITLTSFVASVAGLTWTTAAYTSEMFRAGFDAVPAGEVEAAHALALSRGDVLRFVLLPQGLRIAAPPVLSFVILIFQTTSLCFTIALPELLSRAYSLGSSNFQYFSLLSLAGLMYASIAIPASWLVNIAEKRAGRHLRTVH